MLNVLSQKKSSENGKFSATVSDELKARIAFDKSAEL